MKIRKTEASLYDVNLKILSEFVVSKYITY
jgi:hypothetical protein